MHQASLKLNAAAEGALSSLAICQTSYCGSSRQNAKRHGWTHHGHDFQKGKSSLNWFAQPQTDAGGVCTPTKN